VSAHDIGPLIGDFEIVLTRLEQLAGQFVMSLAISIRLIEPTLMNQGLDHSLRQFQQVAALAVQWRGCWARCPMADRCVTVLKYLNFSGFHQRLGIEIHIQSAAGDQKIDVVRRGEFRSLPNQVRQRYDRHNAHARQDSFAGCAVNGLRIGMQVVVKKQDIPLKAPVDLLGAADPVRETELSCVSLSGRTMPRTNFLAIPVGVVLGESLKIFFCLPFLPAGEVLAENKKVVPIPKV